MNEVKIVIREVPSTENVSHVEIKLEGEDKVPEEAVCLSVAYEMLMLFQAQLDPLPSEVINVVKH